MRCSFFLLCALFPISCYVELTRREVGEHQPRVSWLPQEANDVCYFRTHMNTLYEFNISEEGFLSWAKGEGWNIKSISDEVTVPRYTGRVIPAPRDPLEGTGKTDVRWEQEVFMKWLKVSQAVVQDGYTAGFRHGNGGGFIVAYDRKAGRVYYQTNPR
jgi:hypothetical protein